MINCLFKKERGCRRNISIPVCSRIGRLILVFGIIWTTAGVQSQMSSDAEPSGGNTKTDDTTTTDHPNAFPTGHHDRQPDSALKRPKQIGFQEYVPEYLFRKGPHGLLWWQWIAIPFLIAGAWVIGKLLSRVTRSILTPLAARTATGWDDIMLIRLGGPLTLAWTVISIYLSLPWLDIDPSAERSVYRLLRVGFLVALFWALVRAIDISTHVVNRSSWASTYPASRSLIPMGGRIGKVAVWAVALVAFLSEFGYPVASLVAGLGIGGLAVALAGQKTIENLFGAFSIGVDQPFREGDFVKIEDFVGTVEAIGLRSTRIRTLDRTLISIPNGKLAEMRLESFSARDRIRLACTIGLEYGTTVLQMREALAGLERLLRDHPKIWPDAVVVRFQGFGESSLNIEIMAWFLTADWGEFQLIRQELFLGFMEVVEKAGTSFAFPTRTVHLAAE